MKKYVILYRVSTTKQGEDGNGMQAQERDCNLYLSHYERDEHQVIKTFKEVMSGGKSLNKRPVLEEAIELCKKENATLLVSKLDRLSRDVEIIAGLIKRVDLKIASLPNADKFQIHMYAVIAEMERDFISQRTKAGMQTVILKAKEKAKEENTDYVSPMGKAGKDNIKKAYAVKIAVADEFAESLRDTITMCKNSNMSNNAISRYLNQQGIKSATGGKFYSSSVGNLIKRLGF